jgi:hypothetical protein
MPRKRRIAKEKFIPWRVTKEVEEQIRYWGYKARDAQYLSADWYEATEAIKSLPGYPMAYNPEDGDVLVIDTIDKISTSDVHSRVAPGGGQPN